MKYRVGVISGVHGLKGFCIVKPTTDNIYNRFAAGNEFELANAKNTAISEVTTVLEKATIESSRILAKFVNIDTREEAAELIGSELYAEEKETAPSPNPLKSDEWYIDELVGFKIIDYKGDTLGLVADIDISTAQHKIIVKKDDGGTRLIPFVKQLVPNVDVENGLIEVDLPEGLLD